MPIFGGKMIYIENNKISLIRYSHEDDKDMYDCWNDIETQKGYNAIIDESFEEFCDFNIDKYRFWVTIISKEKRCSIGTVRLCSDIINPDLSIWVYKPYRCKGYGTEAFHLSMEFCFTNYRLSEIVAGCYEDNLKSIRMLRTLGFSRNEKNDLVEKNIFTGKITKQLAFRITYDDYFRRKNLNPI